jgi:hypothetical protein
MATLLEAARQAFGEQASVPAKTYLMPCVLKWFARRTCVLQSHFHSV